MIDRNEPAITDDPSLFSTSVASPVIIDSSTSVDPDITTPSVTIDEHRTVLIFSFLVIMCAGPGSTLMRMAIWLSVTSSRACENSSGSSGS